MNVLIVDDDKLARKGLVAIMDWKKYGFEVVGDIAVELGYDNFHYFAKVFAREHGCMPSEYRKESKNV